MNMDFIPYGTQWIDENNGINKFQIVNVIIITHFVFVAIP